MTGTRFDTLFASAYPALQTTFGQSATYTTAAGASSTVTVMISEQPQITIGADMGTTDERIWLVSVLCSAVTLPVRGDQIVIATGSWAGTFKVQGINKRNGVRWLLDAHRSVIRESGAAGAREVRK